MAAILAVAAVGFMMITGRMAWRSGARTVAGCFVLFGAPTIAEGLQASLASESAVLYEPPRSLRAELSEAADLRVPKQTTSPGGYDPYAGSSLTFP